MWECTILVITFSNLNITIHVYGGKKADDYLLGNDIKLINPFLTKFHPDVLIGVRVPEGIVLVAMTHQREYDVRENGVEMRFDQLPGVGVVHSERRGRVRV